MPADISVAHTRAPGGCAGRVRRATGVPVTPSYCALQGTVDTVKIECVATTLQPLTLTVERLQLAHTLQPFSPEAVGAGSAEALSQRRELSSSFVSLRSAEVSIMLHTPDDSPVDATGLPAKTAKSKSKLFAVNLSAANHPCAESSARMNHIPLPSVCTNSVCCVCVCVCVQVCASVCVCVCVCMCECVRAQLVAYRLLLQDISGCSTRERRPNGDKVECESLSLQHTCFLPACRVEPCCQLA